MEHDKKLQKIFSAILSLEVAKGHLKWKVSDLARQAGMSRPLIYYHLGKTKKTILDNCVELLTVDFYRFNKEEGDLADVLVETQKLLKEIPLLTIFYLKSRAGKSPFQAKFIEIEHQFQKDLKKKFPSLTTIELVSLHSILHGIVTAPFSTEESVRRTVALLTKCYSL